MDEFKKIIDEQMPIKLIDFLDTLTGNELNELDKIDKRLLAKVYQAGALLGIEVAKELNNKSQ